MITLAYLKSLGSENVKISQKITVINNNERGDIGLDKVKISSKA